MIVTSNKKRGRRSIRKDKDKKKTRPFMVKVGGLSRAKVCQVLTDQPLLTNKFSTL